MVEIYGIYQAMEFLEPANRVQEGDYENHPFSALGKDVIIIGVETLALIA